MPIPLRVLFAAHPHLLSPVLQVIQRAISTFLIRRAGFKRRNVQTGVITLIQRFGSAATLNIHLHCLVLDGVYHIQGGVPAFHGVLEPNVKLRSEIIPGNKKNKSNVSDTNDDVPPSPASVRISWARLLKGVFGIDIERCPHCGGTLKIIAAILESGAITKILDHLGLSSRAPPRSPAQVFDPFGSV